MADPLGISFSPFSQTPNQRSGGGPGGSGAAPTPQDAIRILSLRTPRTVGAASPIPGPLLNAPGGAAFGGSGLNLEQLLQLLFGRRVPGAPGAMGPSMQAPGGGSPAFDQGMGLSPMGGQDTSAAPSKIPLPFIKPGQGELPVSPGGSGNGAGTFPAPPWEAPVDRGGGFGRERL